MESFKAAIIVSSDRAYQGIYRDESGPSAKQWLESKGFSVLDVRVVPDDRDRLLAEIEDCLKISDFIVISGGTGLGPRDLTPQILDEYCDYSIPGIGEYLRSGSLKYSLNSFLSRCGGWVKGGKLVLGLSGSPKAVKEQLGILGDLIQHSVWSLKGECHHR
ncbi:MAG: MogA/MoaB family molybdenum cofactor biosynthesis protein [Oligoflexales bacterium]|nr:MogA/MoaB family molybdenum cofactor biosynthesis protein [Oligoflexales bacterium]